MKQEKLFAVFSWCKSLGVAECKYDFPHLQPFSPRRRELESSSLTLWERVRERVAWQFISLFSNANLCIATERLDG
jgi:hypothetical protein